MIGFFLGLKGGYTTYSCFLSLWDSRADDDHYHKVKCPPKKELQVGKFNVVRQPLIDQRKSFVTTSSYKIRIDKEIC